MPLFLRILAETLGSGDGTNHEPSTAHVRVLVRRGPAATGEASTVAGAGRGNASALSVDRVADIEEMDLISESPPDESSTNCSQPCASRHGATNSTAKPKPLPRWCRRSVSPQRIGHRVGVGIDAFTSLRSRRASSSWWQARAPTARAASLEDHGPPTP